jgi:hypothetical protein
LSIRVDNLANEVFEVHCISTKDRRRRSQENVGMTNDQYDGFRGTSNVQVMCSDRFKSTEQRLEQVTRNSESARRLMEVSRCMP